MTPPRGNTIASTVVSISPPGAEPRPRRPVRRALVILGFLGLGVVIAALTGARLAGGGSQHSWTTHRVEYEDWQTAIEAEGDLEPAESSNVVCRVKAGTTGSMFATTIRWVIPDGSLVQKGQLLAQLDDASFQDKLKSQRIVGDQARLEWDQAEGNHSLVTSQNDSDLAAARTTLTLTRLDLVKYLEGDYPQQRDEILGRLEQCKERVAYSDRMLRKRLVSRSQNQADHLAYDKTKAEFLALEYAKTRTETDLRAQVLEAERNLLRVQTLARAKEFQAERERLIKKDIFLKQDMLRRDLEEEIRKCTLYSPRDGTVVYVVTQQSKWGTGSQQGIVAQGEPVREGQVLMRIPDFRRMEVRVTVHEALISQVVEGRPAVIRLNAFPDRVFRGHVRQVGGVGQAMGWRTADVKVYETLVVIDDAFDGFRPNMSAQVRILAAGSTEPVLTVPVRAVVHSPGMGQHCTCFVATADGPQERDLVVGRSDDQRVEVRSGLAEGEEVILDPPDLPNPKAWVEPEEDESGGFR
jgi:multidrug efflux pump subunit AcrA (membrane-fusion protein)